MDPAVLVVEHQAQLRRPMARQDWEVVAVAVELLRAEMVQPHRRRTGPILQPVSLLDLAEEVEELLMVVHLVAVAYTVAVLVEQTAVPVRAAELARKELSSLHTSCPRGR